MLLMVRFAYTVAVLQTQKAVAKYRFEDSTGERDVVQSACLPFLRRAALLVFLPSCPLNVNDSLPLAGLCIPGVIVSSVCFCLVKSQFKRNMFSHFQIRTIYTLSRCMNILATCFSLPCRILGHLGCIEKLVDTSLHLPMWISKALPLWPVHEFFRRNIFRLESDS